VLLETAATLVRKVLPPPPANMAELLKIAMRDLNSYGIVGVVEPGIDERQIALYRAVHDAGDMTVRTDVLYRALRKADVEKGIAALKAQKNDDMLRFTGIKYPLDGGVEGGRMTWPYQLVKGEQTDANYRGVLLLPPGGEDEYVAGLKLIAEAGLQAQTHAVGNETIDVIVRSYGRVDAEKPIRDLHWTIMHLFHPSDEALKKMAEIGIMATMQDHPVLLGHNQRRWWGDEHAAYAIPIRKTIDAGILVGGGTDGPVVPVNPFLSMWWMTTRQVLKGYVLGKEHAITAKAALQLYTINNARIQGVDKDRGSIETGKLADLAVLSQDILSVPPDAIRDTKAHLTVVGGKVVYRNGI
jgi:predicted amidohydrolase YtcJ